MPENYFHSLLGLEKEVLSPDYYQLLMLDADGEITPEAVEEGYKTQMKKAQQVTSTKYKEVVEFLKGELRNAKRTLSNDKLRESYEKERKSEARQKVREVVVTMIQISGNLSEIEIGEIQRRAYIFNYPKREAEALIDEMLAHFNCRRSRATPEQMARASEIMKLRSLSDDAISTPAGAKAGGAGVSDGRLRSESSVDLRAASASASSGSSDAAKLSADADKLLRQAERRKKYAPLKRAFSALNVVLVLVAWLGVVVAVAYLVAGNALKDITASALGDGGLLLFHQVNPPLNVATEQIATLTAERDHLHGQVQTLAAEIVEIRRERTKLELVQEVFGTGNYDAATSKVADVLSGETATDAAVAQPVVDFVRHVIVPAKLANQWQWRWDFAGPSQPLDFRHERFTHVPGKGIDVVVPADAPAVEWVFGGDFRTGIITVKGEWLDGHSGALTLSALHGNSARPPVVATLAADPTRRSLDLRIVDPTRNFAELSAVRRDFDGTATSQQFSMFLQVLKQEQFGEPELLRPRAAGYFRQPGITVNPHLATNLEAEIDGRRQPVGISAVGRLKLTFPPNCRVRLTDITVR